MERLKDYDLPWYIKDDLIDLLEQFPNLFEMSAEHLKGVLKEKNFAAQYHNERACVLENEALAVEKYYKAKYGEEHE